MLKEWNWFCAKQEWITIEPWDLLDSITTLFSSEISLKFSFSIVLFVNCSEPFLTLLRNYPPFCSFVINRNILTFPIGNSNSSTSKWLNIYCKWFFINIEILHCEPFSTKIFPESHNHLQIVDLRFQWFFFLHYQTLWILEYQVW